MRSSISQRKEPTHRWSTKVAHLFDAPPPLIAFVRGAIVGSVPLVGWCLIYLPLDAWVSGHGAYAKSIVFGCLVATVPLSLVVNVFAVVRAARRGARARAVGWGAEAGLAITIDVAFLLLIGGIVAGFDALERL